MKAFEATSVIQSSPERIWGILVDGARYPEWDSGVVEVSGRIAPGETIKVVSSVSPGRTFPVKVTEFEPDRSMSWTGGMPLGLFTGVRTFQTHTSRRRVDPVPRPRGLQRAATLDDVALHARPRPVVQSVREWTEATSRTRRLSRVTASSPRGDPFEALGDPNRRAIVELLRPGERSVQELADALPISRPAVSRHLRLLKEAGLVVEEPRGTRRLYRLHDEGVEAVRAYLERVWAETAGRFRLVAENTTPER